MKSFFGSQILYFLLWVAVCYLVHRYIGPFYVLFPIVGGLALWFWLNRDKPKHPGAYLLLPLLLAAGSCARPGTTASADAKAERERPDTAWAVEYLHDPAPVERVGEFDQRNDVRTW